MSKVRIKPELLSLLTRAETEYFDSSELCTAYTELPSCKGLTNRQVQQFILRNIKRLAKAGLITEERGQAGKTIKLKVTDRFRLGDYIVGSPHCPAESINTTSAEDSAANLNEQLSHHKLELLTTIGEVEEYENLSRQNPDMRASIQGLYNDARDRCSKLLGRVKATEALIALVHSQ